ncbi:uncharacterized protein DUF4257 [Cytobacillus horneckiae]|uniref:DUF4257 domain-containing protein n=1 Tax=Cytobacillus horneckiae TaxID=549687 RepID=A0A2N0ZD64_9BACI|nr:DUF4257 domain-containing protein [Cytobacillus horneckiae]NRG48094.1 DUF4257 domain-containing protein [Bacillus sp. CRN 9]MBN6887321.1 DUF4257 domain-containing protein [Cytobacillus horneckiae]MCM3178089.1 DUF4257 domain-containing protein [Cytobacillus horneckiae]MEC1157174.1 DUF4257 domain-containing protein [Cytobacillus horneckiae]MED2938107.1 DUF4257 domain-containing protein [Cytobacillus horneckiae]
MLMNITFAALIGGLVGVAGHIKRVGKLVKPRVTKKFIYLGFLEDILMGGLASIFLVATTNPDSPTAIFILSLFAGMGGEAILRFLDLLKIKN